MANRALFSLRALGVCASLALTLISPQLSANENGGNTDVLTYHNNSSRTGWNFQEQTLNTGNVDRNTFGEIHTIPLDEQVDGQPLVVTNQAFQGLPSKTTVAYVVTEANTVYAIDAITGKNLLNPPKSLGPPVPIANKLRCFNNGDNVGTNSTPVINKSLNTMFVVAYTIVDGSPVYQLHALDLTTLAEQKGSPAPVTASINQGGHGFTFDANVERQRPALLEAYGNIYVAFGSFCDKKADSSRGWVLAWNEASLQPVTNPAITNARTDKDTQFCTYADNHPCFLTSIWMSGYGPAADGEGSIFFTTSNSAAGSFDKQFNLSESAVKLSKDLAVQASFANPDGVQLDSSDRDFGSGGILVLPYAPLAFAAGKDEHLYTINTSTMTIVNATDDGKTPDIGECFCGPSFYVGDDGSARIVTSGGNEVQTWKLETSPTIRLTFEARASIAGPAKGFFTSISSDGTKQNSGIIWAVSRPVESDNHLVLYAFDAHAHNGELTLLYSNNAGNWEHVGGNPNTVPTVANGLVFVASDKKLRIFSTKSPEHLISAEVSRLNLGDKDVAFWGTVSQLGDRSAQVRLRNGNLVSVDLSKALANHDASPVSVGDPVTVIGTSEIDGIVQSSVIARAKERSYWGADVLPNKQAGK